MRRLFDGQCQCGAVKYRVSGTPLTLFACHCSECQRQSSSAFGMALWVKDSRVELESGELKTWVRVTPSGKTMTCEFCPTCGTRIFHKSSASPHIVSIKPGTLNDTTWLKPAGHIWTDSAQPWVTLEDGSLHYKENPPDFAALIQAWSDE